MKMILILGVQYTTAKGSWLVSSLHSLFHSGCPCDPYRDAWHSGCCATKKLPQSKPPTQSRDQVVVNCSSHCGTVSACGLPLLGKKYIFPQVSSSLPLGRGKKFPLSFICLSPAFSPRSLLCSSEVGRTEIILGTAIEIMTRNGF